MQGKHVNDEDKTTTLIQGIGSQFCEAKKVTSQNGRYFVSILLLKNE